MEVEVLTTVLTSSGWRRAFADALIKLRPDMNPDAVDELSDAAHLRLADMLPAAAAALYSQGGGVMGGRIHHEAGLHSGS